MSLLEQASRLRSYFWRHGVGASLRRARLGARRALHSGHMAVFCCDLREEIAQPASPAQPFVVESVRTAAELGPQRHQLMTSFWNPKLADRRILERFRKGALLWLVMAGDQLAGFGWTLRGETIEPYYFPLAQDDVHLFDFHVFPEWRGRGINPFLVGSILAALSREIHGRAFIEAAVWNDAQLASLRKTPFRRLGTVRSCAVLGHTWISWTDEKAQMRMGSQPFDRMLGTAQRSDRRPMN